MGDINSAVIFSGFFEKLASDPTPQHIKWAIELWEDSYHYDFSNNELECDDALIKLGLAKKDIHPKYPKDGEITFYRDSRNKKWENPYD
jgi:hypothetical protein